MIKFPEALTKDAEMELVKKLPDKEARDTLICRNLRLVGFIAKKYSYTKIDIEDLQSVGAIGLIKAVDTYRSDKGTKLGTYAARCIENEILMYLRRNGKALLEEVSLDEPLNVDFDGNELKLIDLLEDVKSSLFKQSTEEIDNLFRVINLLSNKLYDESFRRFVTFLWMMGGEKQHVVAKKLGLSQSYISRIFKKIRNQASDYEKSTKKADINAKIYFFKDGDHLNLKLNGDLIRVPLNEDAFLKIAESIWKSGN